LSNGIAQEDLEKAKAALALSQSQREREKGISQIKTSPIKKDVGIHEGRYYENLELAKRVAKALKRPLVVWVGVKPIDVSGEPIFKAIEDETINVYLDSYNNSNTPRIVVKDPTNDKEFGILKTTFDRSTPIGIRYRMGLPIPDDVFYLYIKETQASSKKQQIVTLCST
jgi:hypothetical protein